MKLIRLATVHLDERISEHWKSCSLTMDDVTVGVIGVCPADPGRIRLLIAAQVPVDRVDLDPEGFVIVPDTQRSSGERAIESLGNLISVCEQCPRAISSAPPIIAFLPDNGEEAASLDASNGMRFRSTCGATPHIRLGESVANEAFADRLDGVALMAEALACTHATGRLHELLRVFERAFAKTSSDLVEPLSGYLTGARGGFSESEVRQWVVELRHPATHADRRRHFVTEAETRRVIGRMEQSAYDVLLNKAVWHSSCVSRRDVWTPECGTASADGDLFVVKGEAADFHFQMLDPFGAYPIDLGAAVSPLPLGWWARVHGNAVRSGGPLHVLPAGDCLGPD